MNAAESTAGALRTRFRSTRGRSLTVACRRNATMRRMYEDHPLCADTSPLASAGLSFMPGLNESLPMLTHQGLCTAYVRPMEERSRRTLTPRFVPILLTTGSAVIRPKSEFISYCTRLARNLDHLRHLLRPTQKR